MRITRIPWCRRVDLNVETTVGSFVLRPVFIPGMAARSPVATDRSTWSRVQVAPRSRWPARRNISDPSPCAEVMRPQPLEDAMTEASTIWTSGG